MTTKSAAVDQYITKAQPFAQPILKRLRAIIHKTCPDCTEVIKWGMPAFDYHGPFCTIAAFKAHCVFAFWKVDLLNDPKGVLEKENRTSMGHLGRITSLKELPTTAALASLIKQAMQLNVDGVKVNRVVKKKPPLKAPPAMLAAIRRNKAAQATWSGFAPSHQREYIEWITEAKSEATRERRMLQMLEWLAEGKQRHWKYQK
ncbi:MAG: DUF1801 domain-containing protein [Phycisphaerae bacterium]|jgi:uncharacterized protein YdeI (YjbR/CyaY-like superfamily)|nr:DUF1801 domain-containing protein [Phycisphaerae bacterium]